MTNTVGILVFGGFGLVIAAGFVYGTIYQNRFRKELEAFAARLGLQFNPDKDESFADNWDSVEILNPGCERYAYNILSGDYRGQRVYAFQYHYGTGKESQETVIFMLIMPAEFPQLLILPDNVVAKLLLPIGHQDIDFESAEFSRAFVVQSKDRKFAYDVCNPQMMEYLLANRSLNFQIQGPALMIEPCTSLVPAAKYESYLDQLVEIRSRLPDYLFTKD